MNDRDAVLIYETYNRILESADTDVEYMKAVEGDMKTAQRMVDKRAWAMDYNYGQLDEYRANHATWGDFNVFDRLREAGNRTGIKLDTIGIWFSNLGHDELKKLYGPKVRSFYINFNKPKWTQGRGSLKMVRNMAEQMGSGEKFRDSLIEQGFDGIIMENDVIDGTKQTIAVAFFPEQIKLADSVTYDNKGGIIPLSQRFDKSKDDIRY